MDYYVMVILLILFLIAFAFIVNKITFKTKIVYFLFFLTYIFALMPTILSGIDHYRWGIFPHFIERLLGRLGDVLIFDIKIYIYFIILGFGLIIIRFAGYGIERFQGRERRYSDTSNIKPKGKKLNPKKSTNPLIDVGRLTCALYDLGFFDGFEGQEED